MIMIVVRTKKELQNALNSGAKDFLVEGTRLHYGLTWGTRYKHESSIRAGSFLNVNQNIICETAVSEGVVLGVVAIVSIVAIVAIVCNYRGKITYQPNPSGKGGKVTVEGDGY